MPAMQNPMREPAISLSGGTFASVAARLLHEPLLHFCLLGALIFGADAVLHPPAKDNKEIVITRELRQSFIDGFDEDKERTPTEAQLQQMIDSYVSSEILYREGKALAVDRGDEMIRERITFKLQELIFEQIKVPNPTEDELRTWFASNHKQFDEPERVGFYMTLPTDEALARGTLADIRAEHENENIQKQTRAFVGRPVDSLSASFGDSFRDVLLALPFKEWNVIQSKEGWHVIRLDSRRPGALANFDSVRDRVTKIWMTNETSKRAREAVSRLKSNYRVRYEP
jgi:parvulin-like peptidyl-prolyl isomerase